MKVELSIHAMRLKNIAGAFKGISDPFAVVTTLATTEGSQPEVLGKTEVIKNNLNPQWVKVFVLEYELGTPLKVAVNIFDEIRKGENKSMGSAVFEIGEVLGARGNTKAKKMKSGGTLFATVRKSKGTGVLRLAMKGQKLKNVEGLLSKSDPFYELSKKVNSAGGLTWDNVYRSNIVRNNLNPEWEPAVVELSVVCGGDLDRPIQIAVFDHESSGKHKAMGHLEMSINGLKKAAETGEVLHLKQKGKDVGSLYITAAEVDGLEDEFAGRMASTSISSSVKPPAGAGPDEEIDVGQPDFIDYVSGGCELNVVAAIDFTGSNGDPRTPGTLHHRSKDPDRERNDYEKAIASITSILSQFDSDQRFPVLGFGAKYNGVVRHCFQCGPLEEVKGVSGVLEAYHQTFHSGLIMSGPTVFTEVIEAAAARAEKSQGNAKANGHQAYTILLIVTDGAVTDPSATADCLKKVSDSPLSIVIVGVGNADFSSMKFLDDFTKTGTRDIAQFVEFNKHKDNSVSLTSETLKEIPNQLVGYFQSKGIPPLPPLQRSESQYSVGAAEDEIDLSLDIKDEKIVVKSGGSDFVDGFNASR